MHVTDEMVEAAYDGWRKAPIGAPMEDVESRRRRCIRAALEAALRAAPAAEPVADGEAKRHAVELEQCSLFVDSAPLAKAMTDAAAYLRRTGPPAPVPNGWVLVPREPTPEMTRAAIEACDCFIGHVGALNIYRAMLAAAPTEAGR